MHYQLPIVATVIHYRAFIIYVRCYKKIHEKADIWGSINSLAIVVTVVGALFSALSLFMRLIAKSDDPYLYIINRCLIGSLISVGVGILAILGTRKKVFDNL